LAIYLTKALDATDLCFFRLYTIHRPFSQSKSYTMMKIFLTVFSLLFLSPSVFSQNSDAEYAPNHLIIKLKQEYNNTLSTRQSGAVNALGFRDVDALSVQYGCEKMDYIKAGGVVRSIVLHFNQDIDIKTAISAYLQTGKFDYVEPDYIGHGGGQEICPPDVTPNDTYFSRQWGLKNDGTFAQSPAVANNDIKAVQAWDITTGSTSVITCILDSGMKLDHPDFAGRIWQNTKEIAGNGKDDDANGKIDDTQGWDFANGDNNPTDDHGHGTNVGGIVGATGNNGAGYAGMDWKCNLMVIKGLDSNNSGLYSWWEAGIYYAVDNGAKVINMSLVGSSSSASLEAAINYAWTKGVIIAACMGNDNVGDKRYPAAYSNLIAVGSSDANGKRSAPFFWSTTSGSNYGSHIDVSAPGNFIFGLNHTSNTNFGSYWGGTSQATPHVAGLASLILAVKPNLTPAQVKNVIERSCDDRTGAATEDIAGFDNYFGWGRINAQKALTIATSIKELNDISDKLQVYPNPSKGIFTISSTEILRRGRLEIIDMTGRAVFSENITTLNKDIDLSKTPNGVYMLTIQDEKMIMRKKIVVSK
jgi:thermitase